MWTGPRTIGNSSLLQCYACTSDNEVSSLCVTDPAGVTHGVLRSCQRELCTIVRVEDWPSGRVKSLI